MITENAYKVVYEKTSVKKVEKLTEDSKARYHLAVKIGWFHGFLALDFIDRVHEPVEGKQTLSEW